VEQFKIIDVIQALDPNAQVSIVGNEIASLAWQSTPIPTDIILTKQAEMQAEYDSKQYQRDRKAEYDKLNQFEMQFDDQRDGTSLWVDAINSIKAKFPKEVR
jgi:hypothetical protein